MRSPAYHVAAAHLVFMSKVIPSVAVALAAARYGIGAYLPMPRFICSGKGARGDNCNAFVIWFCDNRPPDYQ
ncbi:MAG TPA: hypothetical protein VK727_08405 [Steroidobacteraceae bacterium]|nr:hypothetical protein [Steroidobacteraceae bacterium]